MTNFWGKVKLVLGAIVAVLVVVFILANLQTVCDPGIWLFHSFEKPRLLVVLLIDSVVSIIGWYLLVFVIRTLRNLSRREADAAAARTMREHAEIIAKASKLQGSAPTGGASGPSTPASGT